MTLAFLDTSAIYALAVANDPKHASALRAYTNPDYAFILHELILVEAFSLLCKRYGKQHAIDVVSTLRRSARVEVVPLTPDLLEAAWQRCLRYADKEWDWIDCVSFELMVPLSARGALA